VNVGNVGDPTRRHILRILRDNRSSTDTITHGFVFHNVPAARETQWHALVQALGDAFGVKKQCSPAQVVST
jgi:hypothetical protein